MHVVKHVQLAVPFRFLCLRDFIRSIRNLGVFDLRISACAFFIWNRCDLCMFDLWFSACACFICSNSGFRMFDFGSQHVRFSFAAVAVFVCLIAVLSMCDFSYSACSRCVRFDVPLQHARL